MTNAHLLTLTCSLATPVIPVTREPRLVYLLLEIAGGEGKGALPVNIGLIIDGSDSMRIRLVTDEQFANLATGGKAQEIMTDGVPAYQITDVSSEVVKKFPRRIDYVSEALVIASEYLRPTDRFSLTAFADQAIRMIPSSPGSDRSRLLQAAQELEYLNLGDGTNMSAGLASAFDEVNHYSNQKYASRLILLTDGHTRNVDECYEWARRAREAGLALTTMGVGSEFNEDLLIPLADLTGGNAYYIESPEQIPNAFRTELGVAFRISYRDLNVQLQLPGEVGLRRVHRVLPELGSFDQGPKTNAAYQLPLGNYDPAMPMALLLEFLIPGWSAGTYRLANTWLTWEDPHKTGSIVHTNQEILIQVTDHAKTVRDERVLNIIEKVGAYKFGTHALEQAERGMDKSSATIRLRQAATRLLNLGENAMADTLSQQASMLEQRGNVDPNATKKLRYETRHLVKKTDK